MNTHILCEKSNVNITRAACRLRRFKAFDDSSALADEFCRKCATGLRLAKQEKSPQRKSAVKIVAEIHETVYLLDRSFALMDKIRRIRALRHLKSMIYEAEKAL